MQVLRSHSGKFSSKRAMGILYLLAGLFMVIYKEYFSEAITNKEMLIGIFVTGGGLLGISTFEYFTNAIKK